MVLLAVKGNTYVYIAVIYKFQVETGTSLLANSGRYSSEALEKIAMLKCSIDIYEEKVYPCGGSEESTLLKVVANFYLF